MQLGVGIHLDIEDMIYCAFDKKLLISVVYAFLLRLPGLFQNIMLPNLIISLELSPVTIFAASSCILSIFSES
jgi:hypothetical protein